MKISKGVGFLLSLNCWNVSLALSLKSPLQVPGGPVPPGWAEWSCVIFLMGKQRARGSRCPRHIIPGPGCHTGPSSLHADRPGPVQKVTVGMDCARENAPGRMWMKAQESPVTPWGSPACSHWFIRSSHHRMVSCSSDKLRPGASDLPGKSEVAAPSKLEKTCNHNEVHGRKHGPHDSF